MKKLVTLFLISGALIYSCKKKEETPAPEPAPVQKGTAHLQLEAYDSLGVQVADYDNIKILIPPSNLIAPGSDGKTSYTNDFGDYYPSIVKDGWEGAPFKLSINAPDVNVTIPIAQRSCFRSQNVTAQIVKKDSIVVNFKLDKPVPPGKTAKIALIAGPGNNLGNSNYESADIFTTTSSVNQVNIAKFARFKEYLAGLDSNTIFYINVIPVSYGEYVSNVLPKPLLLGDNPFAPDNWLLKKDWKK